MVLCEQTVDKSGGLREHPTSLAGMFKQTIGKLLHGCVTVHVAGPWHAAVGFCYGVHEIVALICVERSCARACAIIAYETTNQRRGRHSYSCDDGLVRGYHTATAKRVVAYLNVLGL